MFRKRKSPARRQRYGTHPHLFVRLHILNFQVGYRDRFNSGPPVRGVAPVLLVRSARGEFRRCVRGKSIVLDDGVEYASASDYVRTAPGFHFKD
jgi:hypothetical protein